MKTILIPTDFSDNAQNAIRYATRFFGSHNQFILLNTWQSPYTPPEVLISVEDILMNTSKEGLQNEVNWLSKTPELAGATFETISEFGNLVDVIDAVVRQRKIDLVVMGTRGALGLRETLLGSNTAAAAKSLSCPLLVVPAGAAYMGIKSIVFATDYKELENSRALRPLVAIAEEHGAEIKVLNVLDRGKVTTVEQGYEGFRVEQELAGIRHDYDFIEEDDKAEGIDLYLKERKPDLLAMVERKSGFFRSIFHTSITKKMAFHTHVPMLVLHE
jgi:nucleotide-binding universal stress UspA family protein